MFQLILLFRLKNYLISWDYSLYVGVVDNEAVTKRDILFTLRDKFILHDAKLF